MKYLVAIAIMFFILSGCSNPAAYDESEVPPIEETQDSGGNGIQQIINELIQEALEKAQKEAIQEVAKEVNEVVTKELNDMAQKKAQKQIQQEVAKQIVVKLPF